MPSLLVDKIGKLAIVPADKERLDVETAVSGFGLCLEEGDVPASGNGLHPRTGLGLSQDGRYLFLLTIDGRLPSLRWNELLETTWVYTFSKRIQSELHR